MLTQDPQAGSNLLKWRGDRLHVELHVEPPRKGRAALRTNLGRAEVRRREIIEETEKGVTPLARAWTDIPLEEVSPGRFTASIPLDQVGVFSAKPCFFPEGSHVPEWPEGGNFHIKVESDAIRACNSIYCVFPRQFGSFRAVARRLDHIMDRMGFKIIQTLPPFPVPTTYAVMGEYGCPFAATDFYSVDPAMAEFDEFATPLDQFLELIDAVHARRGLFFVDLPANHTGWASALQTHHPDWFNHEPDGRFHSPGAWGVKWADLVELDYGNAQLRAYMAEVFLFWCRKGVDGFRCDAGYMIPAETWNYIVARVRDEFPDTVFLLEGLGGDLAVTDRLLAKSGLDWAYSEIFQTYDRQQFEWYLPNAITRSQQFGTLVHFAETHDNDRLAKKGETYAKLRVQLAALLSWQGAWGIANGVEWLATEKIDVHGKNDLNWGAKKNLVDLIARLNRILAKNPAFEGKTHLKLVTRGEGNTLAVVRDDDTGSPCLVLANLDCGMGTLIDWDRAAFPYDHGLDLVTEREIALSGPVSLKPGEVLCVQADESVGATIRDPYAIADGLARRQEKPSNALFHWFFPRDLQRIVTVPAGETVEVRAPQHFRLYLVEPVSGRTLVAKPSEDSRQGPRVLFAAPAYAGDGTASRRFLLKLTVYSQGGARRTETEFLVPPPADLARAKTGMSGEEVRAAPDTRAILSNGAGAAAQLRLGWARIASQYDAFFAANPNPTCPGDRLNLWTRTRCWLQREGYNKEFDARVMSGVSVDPAGRFARWEFHVPCGMGHTADFAFEAALAEGENAARLKVTRLEGGGDDVGDQVRIVFRPDLEWRSFHATTKAYQDDTDAKFRAAATPVAGGVRFAPYDGAFTLAVEGGEYHHEPEWQYNVAHPEEAARGQDASGDLFSPGWISADLKVGGTVTLTGEYEVPESRKGLKGQKGPKGRVFDSSTAAQPSTSNLQPLTFTPCLCDSVLKTEKNSHRYPHPPFLSTSPIAETLKRSLDLFIVRRDDLKTVIAGYPWFLDWGRDTFIFMRGMIAAGRIEESLQILQAFAAFEENGTLPNIIYGKTAGNRDTTDAQLWFIRCVQELAEVEDNKRATASSTTAVQPSTSNLQPDLRRTCESIVEHYISGTPNGIHMDPDSALIWSPSHFTWMDTNYPACTPRCGYPIEIQALWISALKFLGRSALADRALASVKKYFTAVQPPTSNLQPPTGFGYADCLDAPHGERAADATADFAVRPNQLFLITLGVLDDPSILAATEQLLVPGGVRSLASGDERYRGRYEGDEDTARKPAYHNGTVWAWPFPLYAEALAMTGRASRETALALLAGAVENLNRGCLCHLSENSDGDAPHAQKGCTAQAWSDSELLRVWLKLSTGTR